MKKASTDGINAKLRRMTRDYGSASGPANNILAPPNRDKGEGPEDAIGFGADSGAPRARGDRVGRKPAIANPIPTYANGGAIARARGGRAKKGATNVNVIVAPQGGGAPPPMPPPAPILAGGPPPGAPPMPPKPPMGAGPMGPPGLPPGAPMAPGAMPPGLMPPRKDGGRVRASGGRLPPRGDEDRRDLIAKGLKDEGLVRERASGGRLTRHHMTAGAGTGEGRLEKIGKHGKNAGKPQAV